MAINGMVMINPPPYATQISIHINKPPRKFTPKKSIPKFANHTVEKVIRILRTIEIKPNNIFPQEFFILSRVLDKRGRLGRAIVKPKIQG